MWCTNQSRLSRWFLGTALHILCNCAVLSEKESEAERNIAKPLKPDFSPIVKIEQKMT